MTIVYLYGHFARLAGTERILIGKMNHLAQAGHRVVALTYEQGDHDFAYPLHPSVEHVELNVRFFTLYRYNVLKRVWLFCRWFGVFVSRLREAFARLQPDVVVATTYAPFEWRALRKAALPATTATLLEAHSTCLSTHRHSLFAFRKPKLRHSDLAAFDAIVTLTEADAREWRRLLRSVYVVPNMLSVPERPIVVPTAEQEASRRVIYAGRMEAEKGIDDLIAIWRMVHATHPDWQLDMYGEGSLLPALQADASLPSLGVRLYGSVSDVMSRFAQSAVAVVTSRYESFGLVIAEAMQCGVPVVAFRCPYGPADIITPGQDGFLVSGRSHEEFARQLSLLLDDANLRRRMAVAAVEKARRYYPAVVMPRWERLFSNQLRLQRNPRNLWKRGA